MSATAPRQTTIVSSQNFLHTRLGFDLLVDPNDYVSTLLIKNGVYEAPETDLVTRILRAGDTCIDAGCHVGYYSCLFAKLVGEKGRVFSFDANPHSCRSTRRNLDLSGFFFADVIHTALTDAKGTRAFHISSDDQTGLSSLGPIPSGKETISVSSLPLEEFLNERQIGSIRLLKLDVEGAEEIVVRGLGRFLADHVIDYILIECFDERLQLLETSTEKVAAILKSAGYTPWEYGIENPAGWSQASEVHSRGDCNYLFSSPAITETITSVSLAAALGWAHSQRDELQRGRDRVLSERDRVLSERDRALGEGTALKQQLETLQSDIDWLLGSIKTHEMESARLASEKGQLQAILEAVQRSASWRMLNKWRKVRNWLAPENSFHRRIYDYVLRNLGGKS